MLATFGMNYIAANSSGTILGQLAMVYDRNGASYFGRASWPLEYTTYGYTVPEADGTSSGYHILQHPYDAYASTPVLSEANTILAVSRSNGPHLIDATTGVDTPVKDRFPKELVERLRYVAVTGFSNDGKLLVYLSGSQAEFGSTRSGEYYLLTPSQEAHVPEPSTVVIAVVAAAGVALARRRRGVDYGVAASSSESLR